jgi:hybrid cluster-associated redox disulfide protein
MMNPTDPGDISPETLVSDLLARWPESISVFFQLHTSCVGCYMAGFDTLADVARNYHLSVDELISKITQSIPPSTPSVDL